MGFPFISVWRAKVRRTNPWFSGETSRNLRNIWKRLTAFADRSDFVLQSLWSVILLSAGGNPSSIWCTPSVSSQFTESTTPRQSVSPWWVLLVLGDFNFPKKKLLFNTSVFQSTGGSIHCAIHLLLLHSDARLLRQVLDRAEPVCTGRWALLILPTWLPPLQQLASSVSRKLWFCLLKLHYEIHTTIMTLFCLLRSFPCQFCLYPPKPVCEIRSQPPCSPCLKRPDNNHFFLQGHPTLLPTRLLRVRRHLLDRWERPSGSSPPVRLSAHLRRPPAAPCALRAALLTPNIFPVFGRRQLQVRVLAPFNVGIIYLYERVELANGTNSRNNFRFIEDTYYIRAYQAFITDFEFPYTQTML